MLAAAHPDVASHGHFLADTHRWIGRLLALRKQYPEAEKAYRRSIEIHEQRMVRFPNQPIDQSELAASYFDLGDLLVATGRDQEAEPIWRKAAEGLAMRLKSPGADVGAWYQYALVRLQLGEQEHYRKACAQMLERFDQPTSADVSYWIVWTSVLAPDAVADWTARFGGEPEATG